MRKEVVRCVCGRGTGILTLRFGECPPECPSARIHLPAPAELKEWYEVVIAGVQLLEAGAPLGEGGSVAWGDGTRSRDHHQAQARVQALRPDHLDRVDA